MGAAQRLTRGGNALRCEAANLAIVARLTTNNSHNTTATTSSSSSGAGVRLNVITEGAIEAAQLLCVLPLLLLQPSPQRLRLVVGDGISAELLRNVVQQRAESLQCAGSARVCKEGQL
ncbi:hypothetical protein DQ04_18571000 [Trypanosoma grayi]|uniref:hypothetical protein n=1 Tax=Trypanosoma grayi TaxID=71804 RepID=UPI0004F4A4CE|nr:hypothetical protein DQ04_18571000 [Trypanosoma grayi]KEG05771.1 hypothetical protein DQ04_18571000 [Trypanosoma grayi]